MPKSIDSIGPRPDKKQVKPVAEHKAGEIVRPKGAPTQAGEAIKPKNYEPPKKIESSVGKPQQPKKPVNKKKVAIFAGLIGLFVITSLSVIWLLQGTRLLDSIGKPRPSAGNFAEVGDQTASLDEFDKVKASYQGFNKKQSSPEDANLIAATASRDLLNYLALKAEAAKKKITCTQEIVDTRMSSQYQSQGGKDAFYAYLKQEYGWDPSVTFMKVCTEYYREVLADTATSGTDAFGVYIRWDQFGGDASTQEKETYEKEAKARLERDFLPLFERGASKEEIYRAADISPYSSDAEFDKKMETPGAPWVRTVEYPRLNETMYATFQQYAEGERDIDYISRLAVGENTTVFKSKVGYYAIFRATNRVQGDTESLDQVIQQYLDSAKYSNEYYSLPEVDGQQNNLDINNPTGGGATGLINSARQALIPSARAAGVNCFTNHKLPMSIIYTDYDTGQLIPLKQMRDSKGAPVATMQILSTGNVVAACSDEPAPIIGAYGVLNFGYTPAGQASWDVYDHQNNPWVFGLSCYTSWEFRFNPVAGYQPVNYRDASQFTVTLLTNQWIMQDRASAYDDHYRIPPDLYQGIANGSLGYSITVKMKKSPSPQSDPPLMTVSGEKQEEDGNKTGPYKDNTVREQPNGLTTSAQPYSFANLRADQGHTFTVDAEPGYDILGYRVNNGTIVHSTQYVYAAGGVTNGATLDVDWIFRKRPTVDLTVTCPTISGSVSGGGSASIQVYARVAGEDLVDGSGQVIKQGRNFSFTVPEKYKDGVARGVEIRLVVDNVDIGVGTNGTGTLVCPRNAQCVSHNLATVFKDGRATMSEGDSESNIKIGMQNNGQAIWAPSYPSGSYRLGLTAESRDFWEISPTTISSKIYPAPAVSGQVDSLEFSPSVTLKKQPVDASTSLVFTMEFVPSDGSAPIPFGGTCGTSIRVLSTYGPWLRTQNGNVSAMGIIQGQDVVTTDGSSLGGRRAAGAASGSNKDDLNYEVTYLAMSQNQNTTGAIGASIGSGPFCSSNAYLLARDDASGAIDNTASCKFETYAFRLRGSLADGLAKHSSTEVIYREALTSYNDATCNPLVGPTGSSTGRYAKGDPGYNGNNNLPALAGGCPTITKINNEREGIRTLGANRSSDTAALQNLTVNSRGTIVVEGDLYINANIRNAPASAVSFNVDDLNGLNALPNLGIIVEGNIIIDRDVIQIDASLYAGGEIRTCDLYNPDEVGVDSSLTTTGYKPEQNSGNKKNDTAAECAKQLAIKGLAVAKSGFKFGRNFVDFTAIASPSQVNRGQFTPDFDYASDRSLYYGKPAEDVIYNGLMLLAPPPGFEYLASPDFASARYTSDSAQPRF